MFNEIRNLLTVYVFPAGHSEHEELVELVKKKKWELQIVEPPVPQFVSEYNFDTDQTGSVEAKLYLKEELLEKIEMIKNYRDELDLFLEKLKRDSPWK